MNSVVLNQNSGKREISKASSRSSTYFVMLLIIFVLLVHSVFAQFSRNEAWRLYHENERIVYVKMQPDGSWFVERADDNKTDFFRATVDAAIGNLLSKCLSRVSFSIEYDWPVCANFLGKSQLEDFYDPTKNPLFDEGTVVDFIERYSQCTKGGRCEDVSFKTGNIEHKHDVPTSFILEDGSEQIHYNSLAFGTVTESASDKKTNVFIAVTWTFLPKRDRANLSGDLLDENPLGIVILNYQTVQEPQK